MFTYSAYEADEPLLHELGLSTFMEVPSGNEAKLGTVRCESRLALVECEVTVVGLPAQFFRFDVKLSSYEAGQEQRFILSSGSGEFCDFWQAIEPVLKMMSEGMLRMEECASGE